MKSTTSKYAAFPIIVPACLMMMACHPLTYNGGGEPLAKMTFEHVKPITLYVAAYEPVQHPSADIMTLPQGYVANPAHLIFDYLNSRYTASGTQGKVRIEIKDIAIDHTVQDSESSIGAALGVAKTDHYAVRTELNIVGLGIGQYERKSVAIKAQRTVSVSEHISISDRESAQMKALDTLLDDIDKTIQKVLIDEFQVMDL